MRLRLPILRKVLSSDCRVPIAEPSAQRSAPSAQRSPCSLPIANGQILVPSLFVFPGLVLFAILIVETAKLSQQKVLMQFAMDTSVFMEASQLSDAANRLAYLNSPWPTRVFQEAGGDFETVYAWPTKGKGPAGGEVSYAWHYLLKNGVYPGSLGRGTGDEAPLYDSVSQGQTFVEPNPWLGAFRAKPGQGDEEAAPLLLARNVHNTNPTPPDDLGTWVLFTKGDLDNGLAPYIVRREGGPQDGQDEALPIYNTAVEIYAYFYQLATMVRTVYDKLHGVFFKKTFWLNSTFNPPDSLVAPGLKITEHCTSKVTSWVSYEIYLNLGFGMPSYFPVGATQWPETPITLQGGASLCKNGPGVWQLSTMKDLADNEHRFMFGRYYYDGPPNHFGVKYKDLFEGWDPFVTASAEVSGGRIWPRPKPTYQVRLRP